MITDLKLLHSDQFISHSLAIAGNELEVQSHFNLLPPESSHYAEKRKIEYVAGRVCAQKVLNQLGFENFALKSGEHREPLWPKGIVGSITHNKNHAIAVASKNLKAIGLDIEEIIDEKRFEKIKSQFISDSEEKNLEINPINGTLVFSAKEALFKALYPIVHEYFGFMDAQVIEITDNELNLNLLRSDKQFQQFSSTINVKYNLFNDNIITLVQFP